MEVMQMVITVLSLFISMCTAITLIYGFGKFLRKPHDTLEERIIVLETKMKETDERLARGNDKFKEQDATNEVLIRSTLALIEFEIQYCLTENKELSSGLSRAKDDLQEYLARR